MKISQLASKQNLELAWARMNAIDCTNIPDEPQPKPPLVNRRPGVVSRQHVLERGVVALKRDHRLIDGQADSRLPRLRPQMRPTGLGRHPEDVLGDVLVPVALTPEEGAALEAFVAVLSEQK